MPHHTNTHTHEREREKSDNGITRYDENIHTEMDKLQAAMFLLLRNNKISLEM